MATSITGAERLPDGDYSVPHRAPPPVPSTLGSNVAYTNDVSSPPAQQTQFLQEPGKLGNGYASEAGSVRSKSSERRRGSLGSLLRRSSSNNSQLRKQQSNGDIPPVPSVPATRIAQAHHAAAVAAQKGRSSTSSNRKISGEGRSMLRKSSKLKALEKERLQQERIARQNAPPPRLPSHNPLPGIDHFGGDNNNNNTASGAAANFSRPGYSKMPSSSNYHSSSSPGYAFRGVTGSSPPSRANGEYVNSPVERHESMTHRGRYSYASSTVGVNVNSPRRIRRRKDPTPFNVLVVGAKNSGKTSMISFLRHSLALPSSGKASDIPDSTYNASKSSFTSHYLESEMDGERVGLTLWDSAGLEKNLVDLQMREMVAFVESKFEETFVEEQKVMRSPGAKDTHIHCVFLVLDPIRLDATVAASSASQKASSSLANVSGLDDDLDLQVIRALWGKTTVIPVISKADTLTMGHMSFLKRTVWQSIRGAKMDPLEALELEDDIEEEDEDEDSDDIDDEDSDVINNLVDRRDDSSSSDQPAPKPKKTHKRHSSLSASLRSAEDDTPYIPMSILSPDPYDLPPYVTKPKPSQIGRRFPWGLADPFNPEHCDFIRLRDSIFSEWKGELRDLSRTKWYENWRTSRLKNLPGSKQRVKGGVTPIAAVPREGMRSPTTARQFSGGYYGNVPRSVSASSTTEGPPPRSQAGDGRPSKAERLMGVGAGEMGNGTYH